MKKKLSDRRIRLWRTDRHPGGRLQIYLERRDQWIGRWVGTDDADYWCFLPILVFRVGKDTATPPPAGDWRQRGLRPADIDPAKLVEALVAAGWQIAGQRTGVYVRLAWMGARTMMVPLDTCADEYDEVMGAALGELRNAADLGLYADKVLAVMAGAPTVLDEPDLLDEAMHEVWLNSKWSWLTTQMTGPVRNAAAEAVLRYDRWTHRDEPERELLDRKSVAVWESTWG